jgi:hypothetical protein
MKPSLFIVMCFLIATASAQLGKNPRATPSATSNTQKKEPAPVSQRGSASGEGKTQGDAYAQAMASVASGATVEGGARFQENATTHFWRCTVTWKK